MVKLARVLRFVKGLQAARCVGSRFIQKSLFESPDVADLHNYPAAHITGVSIQPRVSQRTLRSPVRDVKVLTVSKHFISRIPFSIPSASPSEQLCLILFLAISCHRASNCTILQNVLHQPTIIASYRTT